MGWNSPNKCGEYNLRSVISSAKFTSAFPKVFWGTVENLSATGKPVYVMTDANINLLHFNSSNYAQDFLLTLQSLNLAPCIDKPTRVHRNSFSLIDNIFTNKVKENIFSGNLISDISDHFSQFCLTSSLVVKETPDRPLTRDFSKFFWRKFYRRLVAYWLGWHSSS